MSCLFFFSISCFWSSFELHWATHPRRREEQQQEPVPGITASLKFFRPRLGHQWSPGLKALYTYMIHMIIYVYIWCLVFINNVFNIFYNTYIYIWLLLLLLLLLVVVYYLLLLIYIYIHIYIHIDIHIHICDTKAESWFGLIAMKISTCFFRYHGRPSQESLGDRKSGGEWWDLEQRPPGDGWFSRDFCGVIRYFCNYPLVI